METLLTGAECGNNQGRLDEIPEVSHNAMTWWVMKQTI